MLLALALVIGAWLALPLPAHAWSLPGRSAGSPPVATPAALKGLQEVAPPAAVQQLAEALGPRQPRITILEPRDGALLPDAPWTLRLGVEDWPLVDAGSLGLGSHLMVQLDDGLPQPLLKTTASMPPLSPGSHRFTVYAVRPWGEVVKSPGAFRQIRLHRVAANPLALPAEGSPQLLAVSPSKDIAGEPVLLDWLLIDAPLQNLRADDARWRLRVTVNGDSFLVNQQTPLWLKGWKSGSNAVLFELVDGRGEPLNPPFNSVVREVRLDPGSPRPPWLGPRLDGPALARLLGDLPSAQPEAPSEQPPAQKAPPQESVAVPAPLPEPEQSIPSRAQESPVPLRMAPDLGQEPRSSGQAAPEAVPPAARPLPSAATLPLPPSELDRPEQDADRPWEIETASPLQNPSLPPPDAPLAPPSPSLSMPFEPGGPGAELPASSEANRAATPSQSGEGSPPAGTPGRMSSARDEVNADGRLIRPARRSPLQALRERFAR
ncbi:MAG: hypothetical protein NTW51_14050 [Cyanobacteria bacterium]|nr:hypothetical protein [Cyanobacteriota bacterium]